MKAVAKWTIEGEEDVKKSGGTGDTGVLEFGVKAVTKWTMN